MRSPILYWQFWTFLRYFLWFFDMYIAQPSGGVRQWTRYPGTPTNHELSISDIFEGLTLLQTSQYRTRELKIRTPLKGGVEIEQFFTLLWDSEFRGAFLFCSCGPYFCSCGAYFFISFRLTRAPKPIFSRAFGAPNFFVWHLFLNFWGCLFFTLRSDSEITQKWHVALIKGGVLIFNSLVGHRHLKCMWWISTSLC